jgi:hypothetical protein
MNQRPFAYGTFRWPTKGRVASLGVRPPPPYPRPGEPDIALEILREFSVTEFIGKVYIRPPTAGAWTPAQWDRVQSSDWFQSFERFRGRYVFDMAGSGPWEVLHFRTETDETGPYIAVALRYASKPLGWVVAQRAQEHQF